jgi:hypothetical protein
MPPPNQIPEKDGLPPPPKAPAKALQGRQMPQDHR